MLGLRQGKKMTKLKSIFIPAAFLATLSFLAFVNLSSAVEVKPLPVTVSVCIVGGCSGELCVDETRGPMESICLYREEYSCLKYAKCEVQSTGVCGWTYGLEYTLCVGGGPVKTPDITPHISPTIKPEPTEVPVSPICGNNICEPGEADYDNCPICEPGRPCPMRPCVLLEGSCPADCLAKPTPTFYATPVPRSSVIPIPSPKPSASPLSTILPVPGYFPLPTVSPDWPGNQEPLLKKHFQFNWKMLFRKIKFNFGYFQFD
ncbi:hypothetical protein A3D84_02270 [Candidatus Woesebacteria bacterium RIFCSPHIGHO2_02_FULL_42_20]|uniref:Uncharacterized protein n=1 Tax=Candidatus Woesebacteria bacterium RIFCSPHIGHO2_12_FULL_41_24 TaxID=1802510 RepID=A0A1F8ASZ6_9BACT|nr:MAG: hypothetical protein A2W15_04550 [Candidatus Woesebacteria bacterium RBG_16_41_13]OGM28981.1 MAG: hypothetical protein A2873_01515 [Candidatus Woesebacteria bacterium RIFCSPHIGHO2_01_FULL_42_80]OGM35147.1 MAG: hypothetical protein A3D84_02270 [Candidatus Woesebacteria bacterium RIFCSPHIGHO2_02_FULL_42_20]OGM54883.1 MAG: hypothetical protein A3E44_01870 [Candidatus Woesebacteria bacterium RIFCSPHIGHO2_12_FULL_41_24]OGM66641.1 MAG: hypothetical protein A2969_03135 [Candidatus Woesebacteri